MKNLYSVILCVLATATLAFGQTFVGTNAPNTGTNLSLSVPAGATNLSIAISNTAGAYSYLYLKRGAIVSNSDFEFAARLNGQTNQINIEVPELFDATNYALRVFTPNTSTQHVFRLGVTNNRAGLRTVLPVIKPVVFSTAGSLTNGVWHYYQVDVPTNLPGWRIVLSHTGSGDPNLYVRRQQLPTTSSSDKSSTGLSVDTATFTNTEATNSTYFIGVHMPAGAAPVNAEYTLSTELGYLATLAWDSGVTHEGTQVFTNTSVTGGEYYFKVTAQNSSVGAMRVALNVTAGEADIFLRKDSFSTGTGQYTAKTSVQPGSDGWVLAQGASSDYTANQELYLLVRATPGSQWTLLAGQAHVVNLGNLAPAGSGASSTNVKVGPEGWRLFRTTVTVGTLAWRLGVNGATNDVLVRKAGLPFAGTFDQKQKSHLLLVPPYLAGGDSYFIGVPGAPGASVDLDSRQQTITDLPFSSLTNLSATTYGYITYRIQVPVQQIAWLTALNTLVGDANFALRRNAVPNEWNNDAFTELPGQANESVLLVPPTLSDGTFYITIYGAGPYSAAFTSGNPPITDIPFAGQTVNDLPTLAGWRLYRVPDISSQLGFLGWDLFLSGQPAGTELALRRNAVPGRWNYRNNSTTISSQGSVDYTSTSGFLQRQDHPADIWYLGVYSPNAALGSFLLDRQTHAATNLQAAVGGATISSQPANMFRFFKLDVPAGIAGVDLRLTNVTSGDPRLVVRRDRLPDNANTHGVNTSTGWAATSDTGWPSTYQWAPGTDWTGYSQSPTGANESGRILAAALGNPWEPGTYYIGVIGGGSGTNSLSYALSTRFIGEGKDITITPLDMFGGVISVENMGYREPAYFSIDVPAGMPSVHLQLQNIEGESSLLLQKNMIPNIGAGTSTSPYTTSGGAKISKAGNELVYLLPPNGQSQVPPGTYYAAIVPEGSNASGNKIGTNTTSATLVGLGEVPLMDLGWFLGPEAALPDTVPAGEFKVYQFTIPSDMLGLEFRLEDKVGNPKLALRRGTAIPNPTDAYGNWGGQSATWTTTDLLYLPNPVGDVYTLLVQAGTVGGNFVPASFTVRFREIRSVPIDFEGGTIAVTDQPNNSWRYYTITIPAGASGWDLRLENVTSGDPELSIRRGFAPTSLSTYGANSSTGWGAASSSTWPVGYQWAPGSDITGTTSDANGTNRSGHILTCGMGNPLEPGDYIIGVYSGSGTGSGNPMSYTLVSRGIGDGYSIPVGEIPFAGGSITLTNAPRDLAYFRIDVPSNTPNWRLTLETNVGDSFFALQKDFLPNIGAGDGNNPAASNGGRRVKKIGNEIFTLLPSGTQSNIVAGTYYLAWVSEGTGPTSSRLGTNVSVATISTLGSITNVDLGTLNSGSDIVRADSLTGGEFRAYHFTVAPGVLSMQLRLTNRVGNPKMALRQGHISPAPTDSYGFEGGPGASWSDTTFIDIPNPNITNYTLVVQAGGGSGVFPDASFTILIQATGYTPLGFDADAVHVTNHPSGTWRYYYVTVPSNAAGWDLRLTNVSSGDPRLVVRRDLLPTSLSTLSGGASGWAVASANSWPSGHQWAAGGDWTGYASAANGTNENGHIIAAGLGNPVTPASYYIGVFNGSGTGNANPMSYSLASRGIGAGYTIPVGALPFGGTITGGPLAVRQTDYYLITVPSNTPNWRLRLTPTVGEAVLTVNKAVIPSLLAGDSTAATSTSGGHRMQRTGREHFLLLPASGQPFIAAGDYFVGVTSEGMNPTSSRSGTNGVSYTLESLGPIPVQQLGTVGAADLVASGTSDGGEPLVYTFSVPAGSPGIELRLENAVGTPRMRLRTGAGVPKPYTDYGYEGGESATWDDPALITIPNAIATNYTVTVQAPATSATQSFTLRVHQSPLSDLNFTASLNTNGLTNVASASLLDGQRVYYRFVVPATNNDAPVLGWKLAVRASVGAASLRIKRNTLPSDGDSFPFPWVTDAVVVPPYLTPGVYFLEVKATGGTTYTLTSSEVELDRPAWQMPLAGQAPTTPGLTPPDFGDSGVRTNGTPLPDDQGVDVDRGGFHYYAIDVPEFNGGIVRVLLEALSGNPDFYLRRGAIPTITHNASGTSGSLYDRVLDATGTEYANFVALDGRYEAALAAGRWYVGVRGAGSSNARYRLRLSTGNVQDIPLNGAALTNQVVAAKDFRYYRIVVPTNAPTSWQVTFNEVVGNVIMYVRDTTPPGQGTSVTEFKDWSSDNKNHASYASYDASGSYTFAVPPLRPGHVYFLGFRGVTDGNFSLNTTTSGTEIPVLDALTFSNGSVSNMLAGFSKVTYRIDVPPDARRLRITNFSASTVKVYVEQGTLPTVTAADHWNGSSPVLMNQALSIGSGWPWLPAQSYYVTLTNTAATPQFYSTVLDGRNCANDDNDNDGMPDCWEQLYFGSTSATATQDADNDGNNNLLEYLDGTNPALASSMLARLTIATNGPGIIQVSPATGPYPHGTEVTLTATALPNHVLVNWSGAGISSSQTTITVAMTTNRLITANFSYDYGPDGSSRADYQFQDTLASSVGTPPDLAPFSTNLSYTNMMVDGAPRTVLRWLQGSALTLQPVGTVIPTNSYTIVMLLRFDTAAGWRRLVDWKNRTTDNGFYVHDGKLSFHPSGESAVCFTNDTWHQLAITRHASNAVRIYLDGELKLSVTDATHGVTSQDILRFFKDDGNGEESSGYVARIRLYNGALNGSDITALDRLPSTELPTYTITGHAIDAQNRFSFDVKGPAGGVLAVETTTDLVNWSSLTNVGAFSGLLHVTTSTNQPARFYRVRIQ